MKKVLNNKYSKLAINTLAIIIGCFIMGISYNCFYAPNTITPSGFTGIATIISSLFARADIIINPSIIYLVLNCVLFILSLKFFGLRFAIFTILGIGTYTLAIEYATIPSLVSSEPLLSVILGGAMSGAGCGIVIRFGGSTGGSDIVALFINKYFPKMKTGTCNMIINTIVVVTSMLINGVALGLYAIIGIFISGKAVNIVLDGTKAVRAFYIICDKDEEVAEKILQTFNRGVTRLNVEGAFSHKEKKMLVCLVTNEQAPAMKSIIKEIDPNSFVFSTTVRENLGESFFLREASVRKNKIRNATPLVKVKNKYKQKLKFKFSRRNKLKLPKQIKIIEFDDEKQKDRQ